jgi:hypothetical protein
VGTQYDIWNPNDGSITFGEEEGREGDPDDAILIGSLSKVGLIERLDAIARATIAGTVMMVEELELDATKKVVYVGNGAIRGVDSKHV